MTLTHLSMAALAAALLAATSTAAQTAAKPKPTVNIVKTNTQSISLGYTDSLTTTRVTDCYDYDDTTSCVEPCGGTSYYVNAFVMVGDVPVIDVSANFYDSCANNGDGMYYSACATVKAPPATWVQFQKKASLKLSVTLGKCEYDSDPNPSNTLIGTTVDVDVKLACKQQVIDNSRCSSSTVSPVASNNYKYKYVYMSKACDFPGPTAAIPGLTINGQAKKFDYANFGKSKTKDVNYVF